MRFARVASAMKAMTWSRPPQGQARTSTAKTFLRREPEEATLSYREASAAGGAG